MKKHLRGRGGGGGGDGSASDFDELINFKKENS